jgi:hypothetical protein
MLGTFLDTGLSNPPFSRSVSLLNPLLLNPGAGVEPASAPPSLIAVSLPMLAPSVQQWSFGVQREVFPRAVLGVNYVGTHATHLMRPVNINAPEAGVAGASPGNRVNALRPYLGYGGISYRESSGSSVYHSMQVSFNRRVSGKLTAGVAYTWGKSIDDGSASGRTATCRPTSGTSAPSAGRRISTARRSSPRTLSGACRGWRAGRWRNPCSARRWTAGSFPGSRGCGRASPWM